ncbi:MAG: DNA recombination protein RmuC [Armatimonadota bacterium]
MDPLLIGVLAVALVIIIILLRRPQAASDVSVPLQQLTLAVRETQSQTAVLAEKLSQLEPVSQAVNSVNVELRGLSERISKVEQNQNQASQSIHAIGNGLTETGTITKAIVDTAASIRQELARAKNDLTELQTHTKARQALEQQTADSIRRLEAVIAGTQTKGAAGENIVEVVFAKLPAEWQVRNMRVGDKAVEFGLRLPNNLILPIDSKWAATSLLEQFTASEDPSEQQKLKGQIESAVLGRAKEVRKYIDPNFTVDFAIATVPDAIYDLCCGIQADAFEQNVVLVSYSMLIPYLLLVFHMVLRTNRSIDLQKLESYLKSTETCIKTIHNELEGRFSKALTMLGNSRDDMAQQLSKAGAGLTSLRMNASAVLPASEADASEAVIPSDSDITEPGAGLLA